MEVKVMKNILGENDKIAEENRKLFTEKKILPTFEERINFWREVLTPEVWEMLKAGKISELESRIKKFFVL